MSFASRAGTRERLQLFTTNYDRLIEAGADAAGLRLIDRFVGTLAPVFRASRLDDGRYVDTWHLELLEHLLHIAKRIGLCCHAISPGG